MTDTIEKIGFGIVTGSTSDYRRHLAVTVPFRLLKDLTDIPKKVQLIDDLDDEIFGNYGLIKPTPHNTYRITVPKRMREKYSTIRSGETLKMCLEGHRIRLSRLSSYPIRHQYTARVIRYRSNRRVAIPHDIGRAFGMHDGYTLPVFDLTGRMLFVADLKTHSDGNSGFVNIPIKYGLRITSSRIVACLTDRGLYLDI